MRFQRFIAQQLRRAADILEGEGLRGGGSAIKADAVLDEYVVGMPSAQNALNALPGWNHALPLDIGVTGGRGAFYADPRIAWAMEQYGSIEGRRILELGPLEASHTYMLEQQRPATIHSIEANKIAFLRCLVVKEVLGLKTSKFFLGDFTEWLEKTTEPYDLIVASGVLYHMQDPVRLIELMAQRTDAFYLWTHYANDAAMPPGDPRRSVFVGPQEVQERHGISIRVHRRSYHGAWKNKTFCGGMHDLHLWIEKGEIIALVRALGFPDVRIAHDEPAHQNGPSFSIFARR